MRRGRMMTVRVGLVALTMLLAGGISASSTEAYAGQQQGKGKCPKCGGGDGTGGGQGGALSLSVTFGDAVDDRLKSDGGEPYVDGQEKVTAVIGSHGLALKMTKGNQPTIRHLFVDFTYPACVSSVCTLPAQEPLPYGFGDTVGTIYSFDVNLRDMGLGDVRHDLGLQVVMKRWVLYFEPNADCGGGSAVRVERTGADTWVIGGAGSTTTGCLLTRGVPSGLYDMPFQMTLTAE